MYQVSVWVMAGVNCLLGAVGLWYGEDSYDATAASISILNTALLVGYALSLR